MSTSSSKPSSVYVFVVMSLAAFLTLFTICRQPATQFVAEVRIALPDDAESDTFPIDHVRQSLLDPPRVLNSLRQAGMIHGDANPEMLKIAAEITSRMRIDSYVAQDKQQFAKLSLATEHPKVGTHLLEQMMFDEFEVHVKEQEYLHGIQSDVKRVQVKKKQPKTKQQ